MEAVFRFLHTIGFASLLLFSHPASALFNEIISFGDSLTDIGNVAAFDKAGYMPVIKGYYEESHLGVFEFTGIDCIICAL